MLQLLKKLVAIVSLLTTNFSEEYINGFTAELINRIENGIDLVLYSSKEEYPYVEQDGCELQFRFTLALQDIEQIINQLVYEYGFQVTYLGVMMPEKTIQVIARCNKVVVSDLLEAGWEAEQWDDKINLYIEEI